MSSRSKREYLEAIHQRYKEGTRRQEKLILDEFCAACGYHRKHAIRLLKKFRRFSKPKEKKKGRAPKYQAEEIIAPLKRIWLAANLPCSKRLKAVLPLWLPGYAQQYGCLTAEVTKALQAISPSSIDRLLKPVRVKYKGRGKSTTKPGTLLRKQIPIDEPVVRIPSRILGGRYGCPLWHIHGRHVCLHHRLRGYRHRLDRAEGRVGQRRN